MTREQESNTIKKEPLITSSLPGWAGVIVLFSCMLLFKHSPLLPYQIASTTMLIMFLVMGTIEAIQCKKIGIGIWWKKSEIFHISDFIARVVGITITIFLLGSFYAIFPEYSGKFYEDYYTALKAYWPAIASFFIICAWVETKKDSSKDDVALKIGLKTLQINPSIKIERKELLNYTLGWIIKLYFLPLMFIYFCSDISAFKISSWDMNIKTAHLYDNLYNSMMIVDTSFVCVGYLFANKLIGTNIRSADKTAFGWIVAIICYQPFWSTINNCYLRYGQNWGTIIQGDTEKTIYSCAILVLFFPYIWATIAFGTRFSNLTHRGILHTGPYRYTKHPAYISKLVTFFLISTPFWAPNLKTLVENLIAFTFICLIYRLRAITEERNLRTAGGEYDEYAKKVKETQKKIFSTLF